MYKTRPKIKATIFILCIMIIISSCSSNKPGKDNIFNESGMPIVNEKITLSAMVIKHPEHGDFEDMEFTKEMEELTNIHIDWQVVPLGQEVREKKSLAFASGNMPDMFFIASIMTNLDIATYGPTGLIASLNELIDNYAPNIKEMLERHPEYKYDIIFDDGNIYSLPEVTEEVSNHSYFKNKMYINQKWLDNLGLEMPGTTDDFYNVLRAFKTGDPNGNGLQDEIPFTAVNLDPAMMGPWGLSYWWDMDMMRINDNRQVQYAPMEQGFREGLKYWNKLFNEGLIDEDFISLSEGQLRQKLATTDAQVGSFIAYSHISALPEERRDDYVLMPPLEGPEGKRSMTNMTKRIQFMPHFFVLSGTSKNKEAAIRWIDYLYSEEGSLLVNYGPKGILYSKLNDGKFEYIADDNSLNRKIAPGYILPHYFRQSTIDKFANSIYGEITDEFNKLCFEYFDSVKPKYMMKDILFTREDILRITELSYQVHPITFQYYPQFITGEASIDSQWDAYVGALKSVGADELVKVYQEYVDRIYPSN